MGLQATRGVGKGAAEAFAEALAEDGIEVGREFAHDALELLRGVQVAFDVEFAARWRAAVCRFFEELEEAAQVAGKTHVAEGGVVVGELEFAAVDFDNPRLRAPAEVKADAAAVQGGEFVARRRVKAQGAVDEAGEHAAAQKGFKHGV